MCSVCFVSDDAELLQDARKQHVMMPRVPSRNVFIAFFISVVFRFSISSAKIFSAQCNHVANPASVWYLYLAVCKNINIGNMKKSIILSILALLSMAVSAVAAAPQNRKERKAAEALQDSIEYEAAVRAMKDMGFVIEADRLILTSGENVMVQSNVNFVSVEDDRAVIQVSPLRGPGVNGVGGITVDGTVSDVRFETDKKGNIYMSMKVLGAVASCQVSISLPKGGLTAV